MSDHVIHTENGKLAADTPFTSVKQMVEEGVEHGHLVLHFHGGLVSEASGRATAAALEPVYEAAGAYPIFPVWESGLLETIRNNLEKVGNELFFRLVLKRVRAIVMRKFAQDDGGRAAGTVPAVDVTAEEAAVDQALDLGDLARMPTEPVPQAGMTELTDAEILALEQELATDPVLAQATAEVSASLRSEAEIAQEVASRSADAPVVGSTKTLMDPDAIDALLERDAPGARGIMTIWKVAKAVVKVAARVIHRYLAGRDHGFHATIVEEILRAAYVSNIGGYIWSTMKEDTADHFKADAELYGGTAILSVLAERLQAGATPRVTLVGHSTGAVFIAHFLEAARQRLPDSMKFDVVLLAPASTFRLSSERITGNMDRIAGLRMFTMTDENERNDRLVPVLYPHSLLYFVSGVVEDEVDMPLIGMQRYFDEDAYPSDAFPSVELFRRHMDDVEHGIVWSVSTGTPGLESAALKHGDFDEDEKTRASMQHLIRHGFGI
ncbi:MAG: hypothetical protein AAGD14_17235 [Planctomycetota bacterium]